MLTQQTITRLRALKLDGMARAFEEQINQPVAHNLSFEERFGLLVDREAGWRDTRRLERLHGGHRHAFGPRPGCVPARHPQQL
jgi:hypothetical protein